MWPLLNLYIYVCAHSAGEINMDNTILEGETARATWIMVHGPLCVTFVGYSFQTSMHDPKFNTVWIFELSFLKSVFLQCQPRDNWSAPIVFHEKILHSCSLLSFHWKQKSTIFSSLFPSDMNVHLTLPMMLVLSPTASFLISWLVCSLSVSYCSKCLCMNSKKSETGPFDTWRFQVSTLKCDWSSFFNTSNMMFCCFELKPVFLFTPGEHRWPLVCLILLFLIKPLVDHVIRKVTSRRWFVIFTFFSFICKILCWGENEDFFDAFACLQTLFQKYPSSYLYWVKYLIGPNILSCFEVAVKL